MRRPFPSSSPLPFFFFILLLRLLTNRKTGELAIKCNHELVLLLQIRLLSIPFFSNFLRSSVKPCPLFNSSPSLSHFTSIESSRSIDELITQRHCDLTFTSLHPSFPSCQSSQRVLHDSPGLTNTRPSCEGQFRRH